MEGYRQGMTLKALLQDPNLLNPMADDVKESDEKYGKLLEGSAINTQSAQLMPNLWEKTVPFDGTDFTLEFMDLDEFLDENYFPDKNPATPSSGAQTPNLPPLETIVQSPQTPVSGKTMMLPPKTPISPCPTVSSSSSPSSPKVEIEVECPLTQTDIALSTIPGEETYDPRKRTFSEDELRPQPMIKKSKKVFVPDNDKDDKYWQRREKNNVAAKRSRDARRIKENQIALRAAFLERENSTLKSELKKALQDNKQLSQRLTKYEEAQDK
ncbi:hypothetical protein CAPTEDRAFT_151518 [Capitella teleta]|uniref:BZIP domain-containing protein n=1 Tax=Capitella teleta TaxID=283909 RepID=R7TIF6_CAPTE|nr:hypothetical protein CAPTEDRAFT_151518 [Capitella teleta]|eukprot:ELT93628.1 hypothetical protein CAPTEDRAFT_151518 [Capitella teleta]